MGKLLDEYKDKIDFYKNQDVTRNISTNKIAPLPKKKNTFLDFLGGLIGDAGNAVQNTAMGAVNGILGLSKQFNTQIQSTQEREQTLFNETAKKFGLATNPTDIATKKIISGTENANANLSNVQNNLSTKMAQNVDKSSNPISKKIVELGGSIGQMLPGFIPGAGSMYFAGSAASQYTDEGIARGMSKDDAQTYGGVMGLVEGATESLGAFLTKGVGKALSKGNISKALKTYGLDVGENFLEEAIIEPISETVATITGGKETADFSNMGTRMLQSGIDGALISLITGGASAGIGSAINLSNKIKGGNKITPAELNTTIKEIKDSGKVNVEDSIKKSMQNTIINEQNLKEQEYNKNSLSSPSVEQENEELNKLLDKEQKSFKKQTGEDLAPMPKAIEKINNFDQDVTRLLQKNEKTESFSNVVKKVIQDKGYNVRLDENLGENVNGKITTLENGETEIRINPKSEKAGEFILMHEVTHGIETKEIKDLVMNYASKNTEFNAAVEDLKKRYGTDDISSEVVADISGQLFGNQEFINNLSLEKPTVFKRIYNKIIEIANKITGNSNEALFLKDLKNKWEKAYRDNNNDIKNEFSINFKSEYDKWDKHLEENYNKEGKKTYLNKNLLPLQQKGVKPIVPISPIKKVETKPIAPTTSIYDDVVPKERKWKSTVKQSEALDQKLIKEVMKQDPEAYTYVQASNAKQVEYADNIIQKNGYKESVQVVNTVFDSGKTASANDLALAQRLLQEASNRGDSKTVSELLPKVAIMGTELGQAVQSLSIIKRLSPAGQLKYLQTAINRMKKTETENLSKGKPNKETQKKLDAINKLEITPEMAEKVLNTNNQQELDKVMSEIVAEVASKLPSTIFEKIDSWRYLSMLGNPRTHIRNIVGNTAMKGTREIKDIIATGIETIVSKIDPNLMKERTKTFTKPTEYINKFTEEQVKLAQKDLSGQSKYSMETMLNRSKKVFGTEGLGGFIQKLADKNSDFLELEDTFFKGIAYKKAFKQYLTANGMKTQTDIEANPKLVNNANEYAMEEALKATFQQYSSLASKLNEIESKNSVTKVIGGAIIPFKKTPINIAKTGASYSPLGLAKTITYDTVQLKNGNINVNQWIDNLSQGLTGTAITALGMALFNLGILNTGGDDDKEGKYETAKGNQEYSVSIAGRTYTLDWLSPVSMPLFVGSEFAKAINTGEVSNVDTYIDTLVKTFDPMMNMSVLQGINNAISSFDENKIQSVIENSISSYISQMFPTIGGQVNKTIDKTVRTTSVSKDSKFSLLEKVVRSNMNKIPGMSFLLEPSLDVWGNELQRSDSVVQRAFESFITPYNAKDIQSSGIDDELKKVYYESGEDKVLPTISPSKTIIYNNEKYPTNAESYTQYKKTYGKISGEELNKLFKTDTYKNSDYTERAKLIDKVYEYAQDEAKKEFLSAQGVTYTNKTTQGVKSYETKAIADAIKSDISYEASVYKSQYPDKYSAITQITDYNTYTKYKEEIKEVTDKYEGTGTKYTAQKKQEIIKKINSYNLSIPQKAILIKQYYSSYDEYNSQIVKYINGKDLTQQEKSNILTELGFKVQNGKVVY